MSGWTKYLLSAESINGIYREKLPNLVDVRISDVAISDMGPTLEMKITLNDFPSHPPKKWMGKFDLVTIDLRVSDFECLKLSKWGRVIRGDIEISDSSHTNFKEIRVTGGSIEMSLRGKFISVEKIVGTVSDPRRYNY